MAQHLTDKEAIDARQKFVEAWNVTMLKIWQERMVKLHVYETRWLYRSLASLPVKADGRFVDLELTQSFAEYGIWQDLGVGREFSSHSTKGRTGEGQLEFLDPGYRAKHRLDEPRRRGPRWGGGWTSGYPRRKKVWFSIKYYASVMTLKEFMSESVGQEFIGMFAGLNAADQRKNTQHYKSRGWA